MINEFRNQLNILDDTNISKLISISDTIAIFTPKSYNRSEVEIIDIHATISKYILEKSCENGYPIRGAICYGKYNIKHNVMVGQV